MEESNVFDQEAINLAKTMITKDITAMKLPYYKAVIDYKNCLERIQESTHRESNSRIGLYNTSNAYLNSKEELDHIREESGENSLEFQNALLNSNKALENKIQAEKTYKECVKHTTQLGKNSRKAYEVLRSEELELKNRDIDVDMYRDLNLMEDPYFKKINILQNSINNFKNCLQRETLAKKSFNSSIGDYSYYSMMTLGMQKDADMESIYNRTMKAYKNKIEAEKLYNSLILETQTSKNNLKRVYEDTVLEAIPIVKKICI